jgi:hypothetical protein
MAYDSGAYSGAATKIANLTSHALDVFCVKLINQYNLASAGKDRQIVR